MFVRQTTEGGERGPIGVVRSGQELKGSVLGPMLFINYITDTDEYFLSSVLKFPDDTKVFRKVTTSADARGLQDDLNCLYQWSDDWQCYLISKNASASTSGIETSRTTTPLVTV